MIAKLIKGKGFRGAVEYDLQKGKSILLHSNMASKSPKELAKEFNAVRTLRPKLEKAVCHVSLSLHPNENLTHEQWIEAGQAWLEGMGFTNNQYVISKHTDSPHSHIHILVNRVSLNGAVVSDSHDYKRQEKIMRELERKYGLTQVISSHDVEKKALTKNEIEQAVRTKEQPIRMKLQSIIDNALEMTKNFFHFKQILSNIGVEVRLNQSASTQRISGISFELEGVAFKGSNLGKGYTWNNLQQKGLDYENGTDKEHGYRFDEANNNEQHDRERSAGYEAQAYGRTRNGESKEYSRATQSPYKHEVHDRTSLSLGRESQPRRSGLSR